jgi:hypothetical protein
MYLAHFFVNAAGVYVSVDGFLTNSSAEMTVTHFNYYGHYPHTMRGHRKKYHRADLWLSATIFDCYMIMLQK